MAFQNQELIPLMLKPLVEQTQKCPLAEAFQTENIEGYPYVTYSIIDPGSNPTSDMVDQMDTTWQIHCHSNELFEASRMAFDLYRLLQRSSVHRYFRQVSVVPHDISKPDNRTAFQGINVNYSVGFDCSFLITQVGASYEKDKLSFDIDEFDIQKITAHSKIDGMPINADKNKEE